MTTNIIRNIGIFAITVAIFSLMLEANPALIHAIAPTLAKFFGAIAIICVGLAIIQQVISLIVEKIIKPFIMWVFTTTVWFVTRAIALGLFVAAFYVLGIFMQVL